MSHWRALIQQNVRTMRVFMGPPSKSMGAQKFLENSFAEVRMLNPNYPLLIRNCEDESFQSDVELPFFEARYYADDTTPKRRARISVANMNEQEVEKVLEKLVMEHPGNPNSTIKFEQPELRTPEEMEEAKKKLLGDVTKQ